MILMEAANFVIKLPADQHKDPKWESAMHALIEAAEGRGSTMLARIGVLQAIHRDAEPKVWRGKAGNAGNEVGPP